MTDQPASTTRQITDIGDVRRALLKDVDLMHEKDVAMMLDVTLHTLMQWRAGARANVVSPPWVKLGREVYYRRADIVAWITQNLSQGGSAEPGAVQPTDAEEAA